MIRSVFLFIVMVNSFSVYSQKLFNSSYGNFNKKYSPNRIIISVKAGYHTENSKNTFNGFNGGVVYSGNAEISLTEQTYGGVSYEFWNHTDDNYYTGSGTKTREYIAGNISFNITRRFIDEAFSFNLGVGGGIYTISRDGNTDSYFNLKLITGCDLKISDPVWLSPEINYNSLVNFDKSSSLFSFKLGVSFVIDD